MTDPVKELPRLTSEHLRSFTERRCPDPKNCHQCKMDADIEQYVRAIVDGDRVTVSVEELNELQKFMRENISIREVSTALSRWLTTRSNKNESPKMKEKVIDATEDHPAVFKCPHCKRLVAEGAHTCRATRSNQK